MSYFKEIENRIDMISRVHGYHEVFSDFLSYCVAALDFKSRPEIRRDFVSKYGEETYESFCQMFCMLPRVYLEMMKDREWADPFGDWYMDMSSRSKASAFGQFFTPLALCDTLAAITIPEGTERVWMNDMACGSGRTLLAGHVRAPGSILIAGDLDPLCVKMTVVNMCMQGCVGQVHHQDALSRKWFGGWQINPMLRSSGGLYIVRMSRENDPMMGFGHPKRPGVVKPTELPVEQAGQLSIF